MRRTLGRSASAYVAVLFLLAAGCAGPNRSADRASPATPQSGSPARGSPSAAPSVAARVAALPSGPCTGIGSVPASPQVTFLSGGRLYAASPDGSGAACLGEAARPLTLAWSGSADRVLLGGLQTLLPDTQRPPVDEAVRSPRWSRPTGKSTIHISIDQRRLLKVGAGGGPEQDISFLARHDEVIYHPAGTHIAAVGEARDGTYGIFLARNDGMDVSTVAVGESANRIFSLAYSHDGEHLYYAADHGEHQEVHDLVIPTSTLGEIERGPGPFDRVAASEFTDGLVAYRRGSCDGPTAVAVKQPGGPVAELEAGRIPGARVLDPSGWLPDGSLLVIARAKGCDDPGDLWMWRPGKEPVLFARDVQRAAVRAVLPPPPLPPGPGAGVA